MTATRPTSADPSPRPLPHPRPAEAPEAPDGASRRSFLGWLIAAPTLVAGATALGSAAKPQAAGASGVPSPMPVDFYDLSDLLTDAALPTTHMVKVTVGTDGTATYELPRAEVGQGITTAFAMIIADEMDLPLGKVSVPLSDARPSLLFNQITGGSNSVHALYRPVRTAAAAARKQLVATAAAKWNVHESTLTTHNGVVRSKSGKTATYGSLARDAAVTESRTVAVQLKPDSALKIVGTPVGRTDAREAVTGTKKYAMDLDVANALPTMICRAPTINGKVQSVQNAAQVKAMPGITDVAVISTGVAVRGQTFGQCIDAVRALHVAWAAGSVDKESDATVLKKLHAAEIPLVVPKVPVLAKTIEGSFTFYFRSNSPLETNCAIADVRANSAEIWASMKNPIVTQQNVAQSLGLPQSAVTCHVTTGGGSFGRHLFSDAVYDAVEASKAFGKPVKLMWHRTDDFRHGRTHPMCTSRVRATVLGHQVLTYEQRHTSVATDFTHGLGEILTAFSAKLPEGNLGFSESIYMLSANVSYNYGIATTLLNEIFNYDTFHTGSMRNVYSPDVCTAQELITDQIAKQMGKDPLTFRRLYAKSPRMKAVITKAGDAANWGKTMPKNTAQGIAIHHEYKGFIACIAEIDCRPTTVNRQVADAYTGPRVTKITIAVDPGLCINPKGMEAQMMGGAMDGIAQALTSSLHLENGAFKEGSWDNYWYTRQWNAPPTVDVHIMSTPHAPGGAGEFGCGVTQAAVACAYARATGTMPTEFPINHNKPLGFDVLPTVPPIPQSPTNGLTHEIS
jgi:isoquinoline 1-oxidoreductase beta subunit